MLRKNEQEKKKPHYNIKLLECVRMK